MNISRLFEEGLSFLNVRRNLNDTPPGKPLVVNYVATVRMGGDRPTMSATHKDPDKALRLALEKLGF